MFIHAVLFHSPVFRRLKGITFDVHKNPIFASSKHFLCLLKHGALQGITRVSEEQTFSHGEMGGCGLVPIQVTEEEAHMWSDQQQGLQ